MTVCGKVAKKRLYHDQGKVEYDIDDGTGVVSLLLEERLPPLPDLTAPP